MDPMPAPAVADVVAPEAELRNVYGDLLLREDLVRLQAVLYPQLTTRFPANISHLLFVRVLSEDDFETAKQSITHIEYLVRFLEAGGAGKDVREFIDLARTEIQAEGWPAQAREVSQNIMSLKSSSIYALQFQYTWKLLYTAIGFQGSPGEFSGTFKAVVKAFFSRTKHRASYTFSFRDLASVDLDIEPTEFLHEHLQLENNKVKILAVTPLNMSLLYTYHQNKLAK